MPGPRSIRHPDPVHNRHIGRCRQHQERVRAEIIDDKPAARGIEHGLMGTSHLSSVEHGIFRRHRLDKLQRAAARVPNVHRARGPGAANHDAAVFAEAEMADALAAVISLGDLCESVCRKVKRDGEPGGIAGDGEVKVDADGRSGVVRCEIDVAGPGNE
ncbi:hypothetical protein MKX08_008063 [Trichoderma sp. CBMAI-0020]|nr:hypothetical protein MKX08_008063 [Trichoderma sp. CBMAI-0020]WOD46719.1 hypothetical protein [Trichoderma atroviride]